MPLSEENISQIERYIDGEMVSGEKEAFEWAVSQDANLKEGLRTRQTMVRMLKEQAREELKTELKSLWGKSKNQRTVAPLDNDRRRVYWIAAAVTFLLGIVYIYNLVSNRNIPHEQLFGEYYIAVSLGETRGGEADNDRVLDLYKSENFDRAIPLFNNLITAGISPERYRLFLASCYLSTEKPKNAIQILEPLLLKNGLLKNHARWYTMLSYLKLHDLEKVKILLLEIISSNDDYQKQATDLLEELSD